MHHPDRNRFQHTKIVATLGPATDSPEILEAAISKGVDLIRMNMAHATPEWVADRVQRIRTVSNKINRHVAVMMDVKGPEIRTAKTTQSIDLKEGQLFEFYTDPNAPASAKGVAINYPELPNDVEVGKEILVDSGLIRLKVVDTCDEKVVCEVVIGGELGSRRHINLPGVLVKLPALTDKDKNDLAAGAEAGIDFVALSFVRQGEDVQELREYLDSISSKAKIISKIEDQAGVRNVEDIIRISDGIMVARGDLGIEIYYPELPIVQKKIVALCRKEGKPVIIATQLLESMIEAPFPTRAEISDVSNAIFEQADAVMLSGETTVGKYPLQAIDVLNNIIDHIEPEVANRINKEITLHTPKAKMLRSSTYLAQELGKASGIVVFSKSGFLGYVLAAMRARGVRIFAFTDDEVVFRQLLFPWGVEPFLMPFHEEMPEKTIQCALGILRDRGWVPVGETLVVITNVLTRYNEIIDSLQLRKVEEKQTTES